jgi:hypothetical protein
LKIALNDDPEFEKQIERAQHDKIDPGYLMMVIPIPFVREHVKMLSYTRTLMEDRFIAIHPTKFKNSLQAFIR